MEVVIGTYEEFLVGYQLIKKKSGNFTLKQSFTNHAHCGSIRSIAATNKYFVSGSIDESIHIINIKHRVDAGTLISHRGTITALEFLRSAYLFSASDDGNICIWNTKKKWECEKILRGHKDSVSSLSIHSSGKLLLSVSKDKTLRTWNLIKGRCAYIVNLKNVANQVIWSPSCIYFGVVFDNQIDIYDIASGSVLHSISKSTFDNKRFNKIIFLDDNIVTVCGDSNEILIYDHKNKKTIINFSAHENRIKDFVYVDPKRISSEAETTEDSIRWLVTVSSDGWIKIWSLDISNLSEEPKLVTSVNSTCRPTCLAVWTEKSVNNKSEEIVIPELKISNEDLEVCKAKLKEKKMKRTHDVAFQ